MYRKGEGAGCCGKSEVLGIWSQRTETWREAARSRSCGGAEGRVRVFKVFFHVIF